MKTCECNRTVMLARRDVHGTMFYPHVYCWLDQCTQELSRNKQLSYSELKRDYGVVGMPLVESDARNVRIFH